MKLLYSSVHVILRSRTACCFFLKKNIFQCKKYLGKLNTATSGIHSLVPSRAGTIRSSAVSIRIRYGPCRYDTYSIRYTCTRLKVSKSWILDFNNKVNVFDWSIQWILQILVLKHNDRFSPQITSST